MKVTTARITGLFYLGFVITGVLAFLFAKEKIFVDGDAVATSANLIANEGLARFGVASEVALVAFQALTAVWFYKLFRNKDSFVAGLIAVFGMVNATALLIAAAVWLSALTTAASGGQADVSYMLFNLHNNIWVVASLFFGLWLLPMAYMSRAAKMPRALSWFLVAGGVGYILSAFSAVLLPNQTALTDALPLAATAGEFWIIGYLLFKQVKS
jgi:ABC-type polysaccharide/polyol phosphate export permease